MLFRMEATATQLGLPHSGFAVVLKAALASAFGAVVAGGIALALAGVAEHVDRPHSGLLPSQYVAPFLYISWQERYELLFYLLALLIGGGVVLATAYRTAPRFPSPESPRSRALDLACAGTFVVALLLAVTPRSFAAAGLGLGGLHPSSYMFVPALGFLSPDATPVLDFDSYYGWGLPLVLSWFLGSSFASSGFAAALILWVALLVFYLSLFVALRDMLRSPILPLACGLLVLASGFDGFQYNVPSNLPVRFLFAPTIFLLCVRVADRPMLAVLTGALAGISLLWQMDTGIYITATALALLAALAIARTLSPLSVVAFLAATAVSYLACLASLVGPSHLLATEVWMRILEPMSLHLTGFGGVLFRWSSLWSYAYNLASPIVLAVAAPLAFLWIVRDRALSTKIQYLFLFAVFGSLCLVKWVNRSIDELWWLNGWPLLVVVCALWDIGTLHIPAARRLSAGIVAVIVVGCALTLGPAARWHNYFRAFHSIGADRPLAALFLRAQVTIIEDPEGTAMIRSNTREDERVIILAEKDHLYHLETRRGTGLHWMPLYSTHTQSLLDRNIDDIRMSRIIFLADGFLPRLAELNDPTYRAVSHVVADCFRETMRAGKVVMAANTCRRMP